MRGLLSNEEEIARGILMAQFLSSFKTTFFLSVGSRAIYRNLVFKSKKYTERLLVESIALTFPTTSKRLTYLSLK